MTLTKTKPRPITYQPTRADQIAQELIKELQYYWDCGLLDTREHVLQFAEGFYDTLNEDIIAAANKMVSAGLIYL